MPYPTLPSRARCAGIACTTQQLPGVACIVLNVNVVRVAAAYLTHLILVPTKQGLQASHVLRNSCRGWRARIGGLTEQSWQEGLAELETLLARSRAEWKIVIGMPLAAAVCAAQVRPPLLCQPCCLPTFCDCLVACTGSRQQL